MSFLVALLLISTEPADAQPVVAPQALPAAPKAAKEKMVCKADPEADPASHMVKRICHSQQDWNHQGLLGSSRAGFSISGDKMEGH